MRPLLSADYRIHWRTPHYNQIPVMDKSRLSLPVGELAVSNGISSHNSSSSSSSAGDSLVNGQVVSCANGYPGCHDERCAANGATSQTPCTPGEPLTHYHHRNEDHYNAAFACMNRMRIHSQVSTVHSMNPNTRQFPTKAFIYSRMNDIPNLVNALRRRFY